MRCKPFAGIFGKDAAPPTQSRRQPGGEQRTVDDRDGAMRSDARTRAYIARRTALGRSPKEIQRCLKRYIVRELYPLIVADLRDAVVTA